MIGGYADGSSEAHVLGAVWPFLFTIGPEELYGPENEGEPNQHRTCLGHPVNCATGNQIETQTDYWSEDAALDWILLGRITPSLLLPRPHLDLLDMAGQVPTARISWSTKKQNGQPSTRTTGSSVTFYLTSSKTYVGASSLVQATLVKEGEAYVYTLPNQNKLDFNSAGQLTSETDHDGNAITLNYNSEKELETATDGASRKLTFTY